MGDAVFQEGAELEASRKRQRSHVLGVSQRQLGRAPDQTCAPPRKRRRTKSYVTLMMLDNMLKHASGRRLSEYIAEIGGDGKLVGDVWQLPALSVATDSGPDCVRPSARPSLARQIGRCAVGIGPALGVAANPGQKAHIICRVVA